MSWTIDTFSLEVYILYHRRNTELRLTNETKSSLTDQGRK